MDCPTPDANGFVTACPAMKFPHGVHADSSKKLTVSHAVTVSGMLVPPTQALAKQRSKVRLNYADVGRHWYSIYTHPNL